MIIQPFDSQDLSTLSGGTDITSTPLGTLGAKYGWLLNITQYFMNVYDERGGLMAVVPPFQEREFNFEQPSTSIIIKSAVSSLPSIPGGIAASKWAVYAEFSGQSFNRHNGEIGIYNNAVTLNGINTFTTQGDGVSSANTSLSTASAGLAYNDVTGWDRIRNNTQGTLLASAARTVSGLSPIQTNYNARGVLLTLNVTAASGTGGLLVKLRYYDPVSNNPQYSYVDPTGITAVGMSFYMLYPSQLTASIGATSSMKGAYLQVLPRTWDVLVYALDATSYTYSLGYSLLN